MNIRTYLILNLTFSHGEWIHFALSYQRGRRHHHHHHYTTNNIRILYKEKRCWLHPDADQSIFKEKNFSLCGFALIRKKVWRHNQILPCAIVNLANDKHVWHITEDTSFRTARDFHFRFSRGISIFFSNRTIVIFLRHSSRGGKGRGVVL